GPARHSELQTNPAPGGGASGGPIHAGGLAAAAECRRRTGARHRAARLGDRPDQANRAGSSTAIRTRARGRATRRGAADGSGVRVVGIGIESADMLVHEVLSRPMRDRRAVARYAGLTGAPDESGARRREQGLAKAANARVRRGMICISWYLIGQTVLAL